MPVSSATRRDSTLEQREVIDVILQDGRPAKLRRGKLKLKDGPTALNHPVGVPLDDVTLSFTTTQRSAPKLVGRADPITCKVIVKMFHYGGGDDCTWILRGRFASYSMITATATEIADDPETYLMGYYNTKTRRGFLHRF